MNGRMPGRGRHCFHSMRALDMTNTLGSYHSHNFSKLFPLAHMLPCLLPRAIVLSPSVAHGEDRTSTLLKYQRSQEILKLKCCFAPYIQPGPRLKLCIHVLLMLPVLRPLKSCPPCKTCPHPTIPCFPFKYWSSLYL